MASNSAYSSAFSVLLHVSPSQCVQAGLQVQHSLLQEQFVPSLQLLRHPQDTMFMSSSGAEGRVMGTGTRVSPVALQPQSTGDLKIHPQSVLFGGI